MPILPPGRGNRTVKEETAERIECYGYERNTQDKRDERMPEKLSQRQMRVEWHLEEIDLNEPHQIGDPCADQAHQNDIGITVTLHRIQTEG